MWLGYLRSSAVRYFAAHDTMFRLYVSDPRKHNRDT